MERFRNPKLGARERAEDLLQRMTLRQKIKQLCGVMVTDQLPEEDIQDGIGEITFYAGDASPREVAETHRAMNRLVMEKTEFAIPALIHCEALSGVMNAGHGVFPTSLTLGATFTPELVEKKGALIREENQERGLFAETFTKLLTT